MADQPLDTPLDSSADEAGSKTFEFGKPAGSPAPAAIETVNLVPTMTSEKDLEWLAKKGKEVVEETEQAKTDRQPYMDLRARIIKMFSGNVDTMGYPFEGSASPHHPIVAKTILRLAVRAYDQVIPAKGSIFHAIPTGLEDVDRVMRVEKHMGWQMRKQMPNWPRSMFVTIMNWLSGGSAFRHQYRDPIRNVNVDEDVSIEDLVVPYSFRSDDPEMGDVPWITRVLHLSRHELEALERAGTYTNVGELFKEGEEGKRVFSPNSEVEGRGKVREEDDNFFGHKPSKSYKRDIYECHGWDVLPGETTEKPTICTVDKETSRVLSLVIREAEDPMDRLRHSREKAAWEAGEQAKQQQYQAELANFQAMQQPAMDPMGMPMAPPVDVAPPVEPTPEPEPASVKTKTINFFVHLGCIPNPVGFYHYGIGILLVNPNELADSISGQYLGALRLSNIASGFIGEDVAISGDLQLKPGYYKKVKGMTSAQLKDAFVDRIFPPPNPATMDFVSRLDADAEAVASAPESMSGIFSDRETATGAKLKVGESQAAITVLVRMLTEDLTYVVRHIARLNSVYLEDEEFFSVLDPEKNLPEQGMVSRADYYEDFDLVFTASERASSRTQRVEEANFALAAVMQMPPPAQSPGLVKAVFGNLFKAMEREDLVAELEKEPPEPEPMSQIEENAGFLRDEYHPALPEDDHASHLADMEQFEISEAFNQLTPDGNTMFRKHKQEHLSFQYLEEMKAGGNGILTGPPISQGAGGMAGDEGNAGAPGGPQSNAPAPRRGGAPNGSQPEPGA